MSNGIKRIRMRFTPIDGYFFGGERSYTGAEDTYFSASNLFPQQTTILGAIRFFLLQTNDCLSSGKISSDGKAIGLIGSGTYKLGDPWPENGVGVIQSVSPVFLDDTTQIYRYMEFPELYELEALSGTTKTYWDLSKQEDMVLRVRNFNHKLVVEPKFYGNRGRTISVKDVCKEGEKVGITKGTGITRNENGFYRQRQYCLPRNWSFTVEVLLRTSYTNPELGTNDLLEVKLTDAIIPMGADKLAFSVSLHEPNSTIEEEMASFAQPVSNFPGLLFLSDGIIDQEQYAKVLFAVGGTDTMRQIISRTSKEVHYHRFRAQTGAESIPYKTSMRCLLKRGSVLYFKTIEERSIFESYLQNSESYKLGYNHFLLLKLQS